MTIRELLRPGLPALAAALVPAAALAVEGGSGAYLLGSRDTFAGIAPPPGTYFSLDVFHLDGQVPYLAIGGIVVTQATTSATVAKLNFTHSFTDPLWGGQPYVTLTVPMVWGDLGFSSTLGPYPDQSFTNQKSGFGDLVITPSLGYHSGNAHWVYAACPSGGTSRRWSSAISRRHAPAGKPIPGLLAFPLAAMSRSGAVPDAAARNAGATPTR